jgi:glycine amidinotransferase
MIIEDRKTIINSWNEWDPLKHVIVGHPDGAIIPPPEPASEQEFPQAGLKRGEWGPHSDERVEKARELMDGFVNVLEKRSIPPIDFSQEVQTPDWVNASMLGCMPPRDILLPVGNEILEAAMSQRSRWYEFLCYRPLLESYFREDPNFIWESAPKPRLTDESYVKGYWDNYLEVWSEEEKLEKAATFDWQLTEKEPLFDAADVFRFGKDLFVQRSAVTNSSGVEWLRRHFEPMGHRVHEVGFGGVTMPWHIDTTIVAPRPGLLIQNPEWMPLTLDFHELFKRNGWEIVMAAPPARSKPHPYSLCSVHLAFNTFSLDPKTICVDADEEYFMDQLDELGFEVIPVDFFEVSPLGGGLHCATVDIYRLGECEDYFPKQIAGF